MATKFCKDCKWCDDPEGGEFAKCSNPIFTYSTVNLVNGETPNVTPHYCDVNRRFSPNLFFGIFGRPIGCGGAGKYWEARDGH